MSPLIMRPLTLFFAIFSTLFSQLAFAENIVRDPYGPRPIPKTYFNMHIRWGATTHFWPTAHFHSWRLITGETHWYNLEPEKGLWKFNELDRALERAEWKEVEVLFTLGYPARWSADMRSGREWNPGAALPPRNMADWEEYVRRVVSRYKDRIKFYELMNEPHFTEVDGGWHSKRHFPVATMVEMARIASSVIKEVDPEAKLVSMSPSGGINGIRRVATFLKAGGGKFVDVLGFHFYSDTPEEIPNLASALRKVLADNGQSRLDIWNTESGFYITDQENITNKGMQLESQHIYTPARAAAAVSRALTLGAAAGLRRFYWYSWDIPTMALTEGKGQIVTPAGMAYVKTERWLRDSTIHDCRTTDDKLWICSLSRGIRQARLVWNTAGPRDWRIPAQWQARHYEPLLGDITNIDITGRVNLDEAPLLIVSDDQAWGSL